MTRIFAAPEQIRDGRVTVTGAAFSHVRNVLRMRPGEELTVSTGTGKSYRARILGYEKDQAVLELLAEEEPHELSSELVLFQGLPKGDKLELIIQKAAELGVSRIVPVAMKRSVVKWDEKKAENKLARYRAIAQSAAEQSQRDRIPEISPCVSLKQAAEMAQALDHILVPYESADGMEESRALVRGIRKGESAGIFIGPEGGFEEEEIEMLRAAGGQVMTLGRRILRTETAGLALLSVLMFELED